MEIKIADKILNIEDCYINAFNEIMDPAPENIIEFLYRNNCPIERLCDERTAPPSIKEMEEFVSEVIDKKGEKIVIENAAISAINWAYVEVLGGLNASEMDSILKRCGIDPTPFKERKVSPYDEL